jgi:hypothetical protein
MKKQLMSRAEATHILTTPEALTDYLNSSGTPSPAQTLASTPLSPYASRYKSAFSEFTTTRKTPHTPREEIEALNLGIKRMRMFDSPGGGSALMPLNRQVAHNRPSANNWARTQNTTGSYAFSGPQINNGGGSTPPPSPPGGGNPPGGNNGGGVPPSGGNNPSSGSGNPLGGPPPNGSYSSYGGSNTSGGGRFGQFMYNMGRAGLYGGSPNAILNQGLSAIGAMGPQGKAAEIAIRALTAFSSAVHKATREATESSEAFHRVNQIVGGSRGDAASALSISGLTGSNAAVGAANFKERITTDPVAAATAARFGVHAMYGPYGTQNYMSLVKDTIGGVRQLGSREEKMIALRRMGLDDMEPLTRISDGTYQQMFGPRYQRFGDKVIRTVSDADVGAFVNDEERGKSSANAQAQDTRLKTAIDNYKKEMFLPFEKGLTRVQSKLADRINDWTYENRQRRGIIPFTRSQELMDRNRKAMQAAMDEDASADRISRANAGDSMAARQLTATEKLVIATQRMAEAYGGGPKAAGAIPAAMDGMNISQAISMGTRMRLAVAR